MPIYRIELDEVLTHEIHVDAVDMTEAIARARELLAQANPPTRYVIERQKVTAAWGERVDLKPGESKHE
ncbi:hypothetical protein [Burkholderia pseudomallei]|uniref:hypothetical protein n=1 Tax=Burkholderia pseudomallei TaxID=28450 RepID=UPI00100BB63A|nr:hypothetical protein [Burkholderia pseudomallei]